MPLTRVDSVFDNKTMPGRVTADDLRELVTRLSADAPATHAAEGIERIRLLEELKGAIAAAQAKQVVAFDAVRQAEQAAAGTPVRLHGQGVAAEIALARRESPFRAARQLGWSKILVTELPHTLKALEAGATTEWRAMLVARETGWLSREHRAEVDADIGPRLGELGDRHVEAETRRLAARLDPMGKVDRLRQVAADRTVTLRPAPDTMAYLTALLPVTQGVAVLAALRAAADTNTAVGDERSRGQVMADTLVERVTGQDTAQRVPVMVNLVMTDQALLDAGPDRTEPAELERYGPIPAPIARDLIADGENDGAPMWIRRLYADPASGCLMTMETRSRFFTPAQREFVRLRDQTCRTPYCGAPIRHIDHVTPSAAGGMTRLDNAQGLCEACNYAKQAPGWITRTQAGGSVAITTPSGRTYRSPPVSVRSGLPQAADRGGSKRQVGHLLN